MIRSRLWILGVHQSAGGQSALSNSLQILRRIMNARRSSPPTPINELLPAMMMAMTNLSPAPAEAGGPGVFSLSLRSGRGWTGSRLPATRGPHVDWLNYF